LATRQRALPAACDDSVRGLHTVATIVAVTGAPASAVRHWIRSGYLRATRRADRIEWFDYGELVVARRLARLLAAGFPLREIDARLAPLHPDGAAAAAREGERIVVDGRRLNVRRGDDLLGAGGQRQFGFYTAPLLDAPGDPCRSHPEETPATSLLPDASAADLLAMAAELESIGELEAATEALRALLQSGGPNATVSFMLAELLYRSGDLTAARERYYTAIELDPDHLEARTSLACTLADLGDAELAEAALEGVLRQQPDYADAHWHLALVLAASGRTDDATRHLRTFVSLAPDSPWVRAALERLGEA